MSFSEALAGGMICGRAREHQRDAGPVVELPAGQRNELHVGDSAIGG